MKPRIPTLKPRLSAMPQRTNQITHTRIRGDTLQAIRARHFTAHPLCVYCELAGRTERAQILDHRIPLWAGGRDDDTNRQGLCHECHDAKSKREAAIRARSGTADDCQAAEAEHLNAIERPTNADQQN